MTTPATHLKLGVFALAGIAGLVVAAVVLGIHARRAPTTTYHVLFDESVQGLDVGSPVKYRGVQIGDVGGIAVAADRRHIDVSLDVGDGAVARLDLEHAPELLRAQLSGQGLTGVKFVDLDFADEAEPAAQHPPRARYLSPRPSLGKRLEDTSMALGRALPPLVTDARHTLRHIDDLVEDARRARVPAHLVRLADRARAVLDDVHVLAPRATAALDSVQRAADTARELGRRATGSTDELERALIDIGDAARGVRDFVELLESDPDMLVHGRAPARRP